MRIISRLLWKLRFGWRRSTLDRELEQEMRFHLDMLEQDRRAGGEAVGDARLTAKREFGNAGLLAEDSRAAWGWSGVEALFQDLRFASRTFRRDWSSVLTAVGALALGTGLATAVFTIVNAILLRPLPYREPDRLVMIWAVNQQQGWDQEKMSAPEMLDWERSGLFESVVAFTPNMTAITGPGEAELTHGYAVTPGFLRLLGAQPMLGRAFSEAEERKGGDKDVMLVRHSFWLRRFGGDRDVIGRKILVQDKPFTIVGVMGPEFQFFNRQTDLYVPFGQHLTEVTWRGRGFRVIGRLKDGISLEQAQARAGVLADQFARDHPESNRGWTVNLRPVALDTTGPVRPALWVLLASVGMVLLIACANVANLLLAQGIARSREMALRIAIGAGRGRLLRQMLTESLLLAVAGGSAGWGLAHVAVSYFRDTLPAQFSFGRSLIQMERLEIDWGVGLFALVVVPLAAVLFGLLPAWRASRPELDEMLKGAGRALGPTSAARRLQNALVAGELALAVILAIGAALVAQSFSKLYEQGPGFRPEKLKSMYVALPTYEHQIRNNADWQRVAGSMYERALHLAAATPRVESVATVSHLPLAGFYYLADFVVEGLATTPEDSPHAIDRHVSNSYHATMGIPLRDGRYFNLYDRPDSQRVVIVNEQFARRYSPNQSLVGRRIRYSGPPERSPWYTVAGVVAGERAGGMEEEPKPMIYFSMNQNPWSFFHLIVKTDMDLDATVSAVRTELRKISPKIAPYEVRTLDAMVLDSTWRVRYSMMLLFALSGAALVLAAIGVYGVLRYLVSKRTREIGVRMALGADQSLILIAVLRDGLKVAGTGILIGISGACVLTRFLSTLLFGVRAIEPLTFAAVCGLLLLVALAACLVPARRASRLAPVEALRAE